MGHRFAVFLRGMNLGGRRITNEDLCACFEAMGFESVAAFLASGNVALETDSTDRDALRIRIETGLEEALGYAVPTFLRSEAEMETIAERRPFAGRAEERKLQVALLSDEPSDAGRARVLELASDDDWLLPEGTELYWAPRLGVGKSTLDWKAIDRVVGMATVRTHRTIQRMRSELF